MRWGKEVLTKKLYGGAGRRPALRSNNSSGPAALTELKVKIQAEPESDFFAPTLSKVIWSRVLLLAPHYLPSVVRSRVLPSPRITHRSPRSPSQPLSAVVLLRVAPLTSLRFPTAAALTLASALTLATAAITVSLTASATSPLVRSSTMASSNVSISLYSYYAHG